MAFYDTEKMRRAANRITNTGNSINEISQGKARSIQAMVPDALEGAAGDALSEALEALRNQITGTANSLNALAATLNRYADKFDETDQKVCSLIGGR